MVKQIWSIVMIAVLAGFAGSAYAEESAAETCKRIAAEDEVPADERADFIAECIEEMKQAGKD